MIKIEKLKKQYNINGVNQFVLNELSLEVKNQERLGIIGQSGCGKTTLIKCLVGLDKCFDGKIVYDGIDVLSKNFTNYKKHISIVFQDYGLFLNKTVIQNLLIPLVDVHKIKKDEAIKIAEQKLKDFDILEHKNKYPNDLSGGQKQRVAIARAMVTNPQVLILDEPNSALDIKSTHDLVNIIKKLDKNITMIIVSHSVEFLKKTCSKMAFLSGGKIEELAKTNTFFDNPKSDDLKSFLKHL